MTELPTSWVKHCTGTFILHSGINVCECSVRDVSRHPTDTWNTEVPPRFWEFINPWTKSPCTWHCKTNDTKVWITSAWARQYVTFLFRQHENTSVNNKANSPIICENNTRHNYYCFVVSLRCNKTFSLKCYTTVAFCFLNIKHYNNPVMQAK